MEKETKMSENIVVILGSLAIFAFVTISVIALVYNRAITLRASESNVELQTKKDEAPVSDLASKPQASEEVVR